MPRRTWPGAAAHTADVESAISITDPPSDVANAAGDLVAAGASAPATGVLRVSATTAQFEDPTSSDNWQFGYTGVQWYLVLDDAANTTYTLLYGMLDGELQAGVFDANDDAVCRATPFVDGPARTYGADVPIACIGNPPSFEWDVTMAYEDLDAEVWSVDVAPEGAWAGPVVNDAYAGPPIPGTTSEFSPMVPARLLDSRGDGTTVDGMFAAHGVHRAGTTTALQITGRAGVPADAMAVALNVTATEAQGPGFVTVFPCGTGRPNSSNLNFTAGATVANAVLAKLSAAGAVCLFTYATTHLVVDIEGYFPAGAAYAPVVPARVVETRSNGSTVDGGMNAIGLRPAGSITEVQLTGRAGIPGDAAAAVLNVTATEAQGPGFVTVFPCGTPRPNASSLNYTAGGTVANAVITALGGGRACIFTYAATHLVVDVGGYFPHDPGYVPTPPARLLETRSNGSTVDGAMNAIGIRLAGSTTVLQISGRNGIPVTAAAVVLNITVTEAQQPGFVSVYPCGNSRPNSSNLNYVAGDTVANLAIAKIGSGGQVCLFSYGVTHLIVDVDGYYPAD